MSMHLVFSYLLIFSVAIHLSSCQFSVYDQTLIPFSIYNTDGNPNNIVTNSKTMQDSSLLVSSLLEQQNCSISDSSAVQDDDNGSFSSLVLCQ